MGHQSLGIVKPSALVAVDTIGGIHPITWIIIIIGIGMVGIVIYGYVYIKNKNR